MKTLHADCFLYKTYIESKKTVSFVALLFYMDFFKLPCLFKRKKYLEKYFYGKMIFFIDSAVQMWYTDGWDKLFSGLVRL